MRGGVHQIFVNTPSPPARTHRPGGLSLRGFLWSGIMASDRTEKGPGSHGNCYREGDCHCGRPGHPFKEKMDPGEKSLLVHLKAIVPDRQGQAGERRPQQ